MKIFFRFIHQWLGLISGLLVFILAITGCMYAFQEEIQEAIQPYRTFKKENKHFLMPAQLMDIASKELPGKTLHSIKYYSENKSAEVIFYHYQPTYYYKVYLNPYSGKVLHTQDMEKGFFPFVLRGHFYLWMPPAIGQPVVATATLIFFVILITGIILWLPKNRQVLKSRLWFRWKTTTKWKRKNFDIHSIIGFYSFFIALIFIVTGLVWGFRSFAQAYYKILGGNKQLAYQEPLSNKTEYQAKNGLDSLYLKYLKAKSAFFSIELHPAQTDSSVIAIQLNTEAGTYWKIDYKYYDQYALKEIKNNNIYGSFREAAFADKLLRMNYDIHTGAIAGIWGKITLFVFSLFISSLPVTGFLFWYGKKKKKNNI